MFKKSAFLAIFLAILILACSHEEAVRISAPVSTCLTQIVPHGETVIPNGRIVTPLGKQVAAAPHPFGMALSPSGKILVTSNNGGHPPGPFLLSTVWMPPGCAYGNFRPKSAGTAANWNPVSWDWPLPRTTGHCTPPAVIRGI